MKVKKFFGYFFTFVLIIALTVAIFFVLSVRDTNKVVKFRPQVTVKKPDIMDINRIETFNSYIESESTVACVSLVAGGIDEMLVKAGDVVEKDNVLAVVNKDAFELQYNQAKAAFDGYDSTFNRVSSLFEIGAVSKQNYDEVKAQRDAYKAQMELADLQLSYSKIKAPSSGTVLTTMNSTGDTIASGTPIAVIGDLSKLKITLNVDENLLGLIKKGQRVEVIHKNTKAKCSGYVDLVEPYVNPRSKTFKAVCKIDNIPQGSEGYFIPGCAVKADVILSSRANTPAVSLGDMTSDDVVYMIDPYDTENHVIAVEPDLFYRDDMYAAIDEKYKDFYLVVKGQHRVYRNMKVDIQERLK